MLYKLRGQNLVKDINDNEYIKKLIHSMINKNRIPHFIIISGQKGLGKLTLAKELAVAVAYKDIDINDRNIENCVDITIINDIKKNNILIDDIRKIKQSVNIAPCEGHMKVYIISSAEKMTHQAQNALLKSLEEPSETTMFILTVNNLNYLLPTLISRSVMIYMNEMAKTSCIQILSEKYPNERYQKIEKYVDILGCNVGLCQEVLQFTPNKDILEICENILSKIFNNNEYEVMKFISQYEDDKDRFIFFLKIFKKYIIKILNLSSIDTKTISSYELNKGVKICDLIQQVEGYISSNVGLKLSIAYFCSNLFNDYRKPKR